MARSHPPLVLGLDVVVVVHLLVLGPQGQGGDLPHDVVPDHIRPCPPVCQARADRAPECAISVAEDMQSGAPRDWNDVAPTLVVGLVHLSLGVRVVKVEQINRKGDREG